MKKILSLILSFVMILSVFSGMTITAQAANEEYAMWFMNDLYISQVPGGDYSHKGTQNFDVVGKNSNNIFAPFTCKILKIHTGYSYGNTVIVESTNKVHYADGTLDYMTMAFAHDNDVSDLKVGKVISQGQVFYQTGTYGNAQGRHSHVTCIKGKYKNDMWTKNSYGNYCSPEAISPTKALYISANTKVIDSKGLSFKKIDNKVTVNFNGNGGTVKGTSSFSIDKGKSLGESWPSCTRTDGYVFKGWYNNANGIKCAQDTVFNSNTTLSARWEYADTPFIDGGAYFIRALHSGLYLQPDSSNERSSVKQRAYTGNTNQIWRFEKDGAYYLLHTANGDRVLDMTDGKSNLKVPMQIYHKTASNNLRFAFLYASNSAAVKNSNVAISSARFVSIHSKSTGRALDVAGTSSGDGAQLQTYYYLADERANNKNQVFAVEEYTKRRVWLKNNLSNNYLASTVDSDASSRFISRDTSAVEVKVNAPQRALIITAKQAGSSGKDMQFSVGMNGSRNYDFSKADTSTKTIVFRAKSTVNGAKINFRWGYDSTTPIATATLSTSWQTYTLALPRTQNSGSNLHPWVDRACTIQMDNLALVDDTNNYDIGVTGGGFYKDYYGKYTLTEADLPQPTETKADCHFTGWYTKCVGGEKANYVDILDGNVNLYAHWENHSWSVANVVAPTCTEDGYTVLACPCGATNIVDRTSAIGHNFSNNTPNCYNCGTPNPNYSAPKAPATQPAVIQPAYVEPVTPIDNLATAVPSYQPAAPVTETTTAKKTSKPKGAKFKKVKGSKKAIALTWAKVKGVKGYQIQVATDKEFKKNKKTVTIKKQKTTKTTVKKLKAKKKYFVRIRTYKTVNGKKVYSSWSKAKTVKTK